MRYVLGQVHFVVATAFGSFSFMSFWSRRTESEEDVHEDRGSRNGRIRCSRKSSRDCKRVSLVYLHH